MTLFQTILGIINAPHIIEILGWMFAFAILVGSILDDRGRHLRDWVFAVVIYAMFSLIAGYTYSSYLRPTDINAVLGFYLIVTLDYCIGLSIGWLVTYFTRRRLLKQYYKKRI